MIRGLGRAVFAVLLATTLVVPALPTMACGPDLSPPTFIENEHPDWPPDAYADGKLGVILPSYTESYLVIAFRYFSGKPPSGLERRQFVALWSHYHQNDDGLPGQESPAESEWDDAQQEWQQMIQLKVPDSPQMSAAGHFMMVNLPQTYESYDNCLADSYRTAAKTLRARVQQFGAKSPAVRSWLEAQIVVFQNCKGGGTSIPAEARSDLPPMIRADRDYQIAAANFYAGNWDEAEKRFVAIADDPASPWRATAALVAARCEIRKGLLGTNDSEAWTKGLSNADQQLKKIIADPESASVKSGAEQLRGFVEFRLTPDDRLIELSESLAKGASPETFGQDVDDYTKLVQRRGPIFARTASLREKSAMTDWVMSFRFGDETRMITRWQNTHSLPWLVAALTVAKSDTPQLPLLMDAAAKVPSSSPAYLTVAFQRDRLLAETGQQVQARQNIDKILDLPQSRIPISSKNQFLALRMKLSQNLDEFLRFAPRMAADPGGLFPQFNSRQAAMKEPLFDGDAAITLTETMPLNVMMDAARSTVLPPPLRQHVAVAAWTRAIILRNDSAAQQIAPVLVDLAPQLKAGFAPYSSAEDEKSREFAAIFILLKTPGSRPFVGTGDSRKPWFTPEGLGEIDSLRDNWWCSMTPRTGGSPAYNQANLYQNFNPGFSEPMYQIYPDRKIPEPAFLTSKDGEVAQNEWAVLAGLPAGPDWLAQETIAWAKAQPEDPRIPEALHLVVHATRYGCRDAKTADYSKQAFTLLHSQYPKNEWTARTPYWFK